MAAFAEFAREVLHAEGPGKDVPSDAARAFDGYLDEWVGAGEIPGDVTWSTSVDPELAEYLVYAFFRVATEVNDAAGDEQVVPDDAAPFYWLLVTALLDALTEEGGSQAEFAAHLREFWPGDHQFE
jgi:hypothetical protein